MPSATPTRAPWKWRFAEERQKVNVTVQDDGAGFDTRFTRGLGLLGMEERVRRLGGRPQDQLASRGEGRWFTRCCRWPNWTKGTDMKPIRILLADDHTVVRDGLRALLEREPDMTVVAEAADGRESVRLAETEAPDVVVMDLAMPNMNGMEATRRIVAANARVGVVILSMHQDESYVLGSLKAGAKGYLLKDSMRGEVVQAIRAVSQGRSFLTRKIARILQEDYVSRLQQRGLEDRYELLSDREREVLQMHRRGAFQQGSREPAEYQRDHGGNPSRSHPAEARYSQRSGTHSVCCAQGHHLVMPSRANRVYPLIWIDFATSTARHSRNQTVKAFPASI